jgi:hypothetical protein
VIALWRFGSPLGVQFPKRELTWECEGSFLHILRGMRCDSWATLLACTLASRCFGHEPKVRVVIKNVLWGLDLFERWNVGNMGLPRCCDVTNLQAWNPMLRTILQHIFKLSASIGRSTWPLLWGWKKRPIPYQVRAMKIHVFIKNTCNNYDLS